MDVIAFLRKGIIVGVAVVVDSLPSVSSTHTLVALDTDGWSQPLVDAILGLVNDESTLTGVNSINLNHLFNI